MPHGDHAHDPDAHGHGHRHEHEDGTGIITPKGKGMSTGKATAMPAKVDQAAVQAALESLPGAVGVHDPYI